MNNDLFDSAPGLPGIGAPETTSSSTEEEPAQQRSTDDQLNLLLTTPDEPELELFS